MKKNPTLVFIVCSAGGRVGKTTMARLLADYYLLSGRPFVGFDTHPYEPRFAERFPKTVGIVDLNCVQGQMALFDPLLVPDDVPKIIDLWHHSLDPFFALWDHTGFVTEARHAGVAPVLVFFAEPSPHSAALACRIAARHPGVILVTVQNEAAHGPHQIDQHPLARFPPSRALKMPPLDPILRETVDAPSFSFSRFMLAPPSGISIVLRACLKSWIMEMISQFKSLELGVTFKASEYPG